MLNCAKQPDQIVQQDGAKVGVPEGQGSLQVSVLWQGTCLQRPLVWCTQGCHVPSCQLFCPSNPPQTVGGPGRHGTAASHPTMMQILAHGRLQPTTTMQPINKAVTRVCIPTLYAEQGIARLPGVQVAKSPSNSTHAQMVG